MKKVIAYVTEKGTLEQNISQAEFIEFKEALKNVWPENVDAFDMIDLATLWYNFEQITKIRNLIFEQSRSAKVSKPYE